MALSPPPPPPKRRPRVARFNNAPDELSYVVVDRITSIRIIAPERPAELDWNAYGAAIWRVRVHLGADVIEREFRARWYFDDGSASDPFQAFMMAREDAIVFARELNQQLNELR